jgi:hypothetical protein
MEEDTYFSFFFKKTLLIPELACLWLWISIKELLVFSRFGVKVFNAYLAVLATELHSTLNPLLGSGLWKPLKETAGKFGLGWARLGWAGLGWAGLGSVREPTDFDNSCQDLRETGELYASSSRWL